jgi:hypothetical protein
MLPPAFLWSLFYFILPLHVASFKGGASAAKHSIRAKDHEIRMWYQNDLFWRYRGGSSAKSEALDFYNVLRIPSGTPQEDIAHAYRRRALKVHPDKNVSPNAQIEFVQLGEAYEVLKDPIRREQYDRWRARMRQGKALPHEEHANTFTEEGVQQQPSSKRPPFKPTKQPRKAFTMDDALRTFNSHKKEAAKVLGIVVIFTFPLIIDKIVVTHPELMKALCRAFGGVMAGVSKLPRKASHMFLRIMPSVRTRSVRSEAAALGMTEKEFKRMQSKWASLEPEMVKEESLKRRRAFFSKVSENAQSFFSPFGSIISQKVRNLIGLKSSKS